MQMTTLALVGLLASSAFSAVNRSAVRLPNESFQAAKLRFLASVPDTEKNLLQYSPFTQQLTQDQVQASEHWVATKKEAEVVFDDIRDRRFLVDSTTPDFSRRIPWLYPDDGCYARTEQSMRELKTRHSDVEFQKLYIFGNLNVATPNSPAGKVRWWYHVAPAAKFGNDIVVMDPAIGASDPLLLAEWVALQTSDPDFVEFAICDAASYGPEWTCRGGVSVGDEELRSTTVHFLRAEWERQELLGRDPYSVLGDSPPWSDESFLLFSALNELELRPKVGLWQGLLSD